MNESLVIIRKDQGLILKTFGKKRTMKFNLKRKNNEIQLF